MTSPKFSMTTHQGKTYCQRHRLEQKLVADGTTQEHSPFSSSTPPCCICAESWTLFHDMHSGGGQKLPWAKIYIKAPEEKAKEIFSHVFDRHPENVTCHCCGEDYSISEGQDLAQLTGYHRNCAYDGGKCVEKPREGYEGKYLSLEDYREQGGYEGWSAKALFLEEPYELTSEQKEKINGHSRY